MDTTPMLDEVAARLEAHEREAARLRVEVAALRSSATPPGRAGRRPTTGPSTGDTTPPRRHRGVDRRRLLHGAAAAAGVAVVGAMAVGPATPAGAATLVGSGNPGVRGDGIGGDGVQGNTNQAGASGVYGNSSTAGAVGITGRHFAGGTTIEGIATGSPTGSSIGIRGQGPTYGVIGQSTYPGDSVGVYGTGAGIGGAFGGTMANLFLPATAGASPPPSQTAPPGAAGCSPTRTGRSGTARPRVPRARGARSPERPAPGASTSSPTPHACTTAAPASPHWVS